MSTHTVSVTTVQPEQVQGTTEEVPQTPVSQRPEVQALVRTLIAGSKMKVEQQLVRSSSEYEAVEVAAGKWRILPKS